MNENTSVMMENMIRWAQSKLGEREYGMRCLAFMEDALENSSGIQIVRGSCARELAEHCADDLRQGEPERGSFVFYDCNCLTDEGMKNQGHCGISLGGGKVIHAWGMVRIDTYLGMEQKTCRGGDHPRYLGWVPMERVLAQKSESVIPSGEI